LTTVANDRRMIAQLQDIVPTRFTSMGPEKLDEHIEKLCRIKGQEDSIEEGWDMSWLEKVTNILLDDLANQIIGSCVATSHITLLATRMLHQVVLVGEAIELLGKKLSSRESICPFGPFSYRAGRKYAGINGRGDGSTCSGQIRGTMALGFLPCDTAALQSDFFPEPKSTDLYRSWGSNDTLMNTFLQVASSYDLEEAPEVNTADQAKIFLVDEKKPLQICSGWGFAPTNKRLPNGDYLHTKSGSWAHSMQVIAIVRMTDRNWYVKIRNQWGKYHKGKNYFWVSLEEFARWIRDSSTMAIGKIVSRKSKEVIVFPVGT